MKIVAIVQARMGSTRLPGKVLLDLCGTSVLRRVTCRVRLCRLIDEVMIATTTCSADEAIVEEAQHLGVGIFRGDELDVLDRYYRAAKMRNADVIVRITSDCPLIDPEITGETIKRFLAEKPDYASNALERTYPRGLDTEVMMFEAVERAWREAAAPYQRAHVTPYLYENPHLFTLLSVKSSINYSQHRWTLDTAEDLEFLRRIYQLLGGKPNFTWRDVLEIVEREPAIAEINKNVATKALEEG
jgi:spore coat polysaccharide biosynthesis protein SpsF